MARKIESDGRALANLLTGSWRSSLPPLQIPAKELETLAPLLLRSGVAALAWRRVQHSDVRTKPLGATLRDAYRFNTVHAVLKQQSIEKIFSAFRSAGIEPILVKGWAVARVYPELGLRPFGDFDLCIRPDQAVRAETALGALKEIRYQVDLHLGLEKFGGGDFDSVYERSHLVQLGTTAVRVLCAEDHLRILCVHMLREGAWRPVWLCDIAAAVESRPAGFEWNRCLTSYRRLADWVICAARLAHELLGADIDLTPAAKENRPLPRWLVPTVLKEWESSSPSMVQRHRAPMGTLIRSELGLWKGIRSRWPNPIEATIGARGKFNNAPRLPYQLADCLSRTAKFAAGLPNVARGN